jgi:hypothetical protein
MLRLQYIHTIGVEQHTDRTEIGMATNNIILEKRLKQSSLF